MHTEIIREKPFYHSYKNKSKKQKTMRLVAGSKKSWPQHKRYKISKNAKPYLHDAMRADYNISAASHFP